MPNTPGKEQEAVTVVQANPAASCPITSRPYIEPAAKFHPVVLCQSLGKPASIVIPSAVEGPLFPSCHPERSRGTSLRLYDRDLCSAPTSDGQVYADFSFIALILALTSFFTNVIGAGSPIGKLTMAFVVA